MKYQGTSTQTAGFTLVETLVASTIAAVCLASIVIGSVSLQTIFSASDGALKSGADQSRVLDYLTRDLRQALTVTVSNSGQMLTLTLPDYIDSATGLPRIPSVKPGSSSYGIPQGVVNYGAANAPVTVIYFPANAPVAPSTTYVFQANGAYLVRQQGNTQTVISRDCTTLQLSFVDNTSSVRASISFAPRFNFQNQTVDRTGTTIYATATLRNTRRN